MYDLILNGENSGVEFKRDDVRPERVASEIVAFLNLEGGQILLGVEEGGVVSGLSRAASEAEEWVMQLARDHIQPSVIPYWETLQWRPDTTIGIISVPKDAPDKPYKVKRGSGWATRIRVGTTTRDATREEESRLYQQSGWLRYGTKPVIGTTVEDLNHRRLADYFGSVLDGAMPLEDEHEHWLTLLQNHDFATIWAGNVAATVDGMLLFGQNLRRFLPQSGVRAVCYIGTGPDYPTRADEEIKGPLTPLLDRNGLIVETGVIDGAWDFVRRNTAVSAHLDGPRRIDRWDYPEEVVREAIVNALVHRDYSVTGTDVTLLVFSDHLEIISPGRLPNTVTIEGMRTGARYARNQTLVNVMRDYGYVDARGMGIRNKIIPGMLTHNGTSPDLIEEASRFIVRLWKGPTQG